MGLWSQAEVQSRTLYPAYVGIRDERVGFSFGRQLWLHALLTLLLARAWFKLHKGASS